MCQAPKTSIPSIATQITTRTVLLFHATVTSNANATFKHSSHRQGNCKNCNLGRWVHKRELADIISNAATATQASKADEICLRLRDCQWRANTNPTSKGAHLGAAGNGRVRVKATIPASPTYV